MTHIQTIPLAKLKPSQLNVRKIGGKAIDELAASIKATGLQQNLGVVAEGDHFGVVFGGRRLRALQALKKSGDLPEDLAAGIPCRVLTVLEAKEASLAENTLRQAMHPLDQFQAFQALVDDGLGEAEVAARFGVTETVVRQRLRLARVSKKLLDAYNAGDMTLEQLQAYAVSDDHDRQEAHWKRVRGNDWQSRPEDIRRDLLRDEVSGSDARVELVGLQAYLDAGGQVRRDLFSDAVVILDVPLLDRLADAFLEEMAEILRADGWGWVEVGGERPSWNTPKIEGDRPESSKEELAELWRLEDLAEERALTPAEQVRLLMLEEPVYTAEQKAASGVRLLLSTSGYGRRLSVHMGLLRDRQEAPAAPQREQDDDRQTVQVGTHERKVKKPGAPSFAAVQRLQAEASAIVQLQVAKAPHMALALLVAQLAVDLYSGGDRYSWDRARESVFIGSRQTGRVHGPFRAVVEEGPLGQRLHDLEEAARAKLPERQEGLLAWALAQDLSTLLDLLALLVAREVDAVDGAPTEPGTVVTLAGALGINLGEHWRATEEWLGTLPKSVIVAMATDAAGEKRAEPLARLKKDALPAAALPLLHAGWLPGPLKPVEAPSRKKAGARGKAAAAGDV